MTSLHIPDADERADLGAFIGRVVRLDAVATVRLQAAKGMDAEGMDAERMDAEGIVTAWASTPFDVLATRAVRGSLDPAEVTVPASSLLTALSVERAGTVDPGSGGLWSGELPPVDGWAVVDDVPAEEIERLTERGLALARENAGPMGPPASLLDQIVLTVTAQAEPAVKVPMRALFALSGMGFVAGGAGDLVRVSATGSWMRLDARYGAVVRRRITTLPLLLA